MAYMSGTPLTQRQRYEQARTQPLIRKFEAMLKDMGPAYMRDAQVHGFLKEMIIHESQREPGQPGAAEDILLGLVRQLLEFRAQAIGDEVARLYGKPSFPEGPKGSWYENQREQMKAGYKESMQAFPKVKLDPAGTNVLSEDIEKYMTAQFERVLAGTDRAMTAVVKSDEPLMIHDSASCGREYAYPVEQPKVLAVMDEAAGFNEDHWDACNNWCAKQVAIQTPDPEMAGILSADASVEGPYAGIELTPILTAMMGWPTPPDPDATPPPDLPKEVPSLCKLRHNFIDGVCSRCGAKEWA